jgi:hypothetical protein
VPGKRRVVITVVHAVVMFKKIRYFTKPLGK